MPLTIGEVYTDLQQQGRKALVAYVTAGDPDLQFTYDIIAALEKSGVDIVELGVPFNHPIGDGPLIQASAKRALANRVYLKEIFPLVEKLRTNDVKLPIVLFSYHNPVFSYGYDALAKKGMEVGVSASLIVDLPAEESQQYRQSLNNAGIDTVFIATPTTSTERLTLINEATSGFCYYVSYAGVTGSKQDVSTSLGNEVADLRKYIDKPIFVGFGIRTAEHARKIGKIADGIIVGSAFVECIEKASSIGEAKKQIIALASSLRQALDE
jgi:tryptophan synthase alpha chain